MNALDRAKALLCPAFAAAALACASPPAPEPQWALGDPLPGLTVQELARFEAGRQVFSRVFLAEEGLGPTFNENSCNACHSDPTIGGGGDETDTHATRFTPPDRCDLLESQGGHNVRDQTTPIAAAQGVNREVIPEDATRGYFTPPALFGRGLIERITDESLLALADPDDADGDGISGRVGRTASGAVGRFRRKADVATLADIAEGGVLVELGLTTPSHPREEVYSGPVPAGADPVAEPEIDQPSIDAIADFLRFLAPPPRVEIEEEEARRTVSRGEQLFTQVGCAACHTPTLTTGPSDIAALDRREVRLYSNLLLHDMGADLADACAPGATPSELRTEILAGLHLRRRYLHDGRAFSLPEAIALHGGEGAASRAAYDALSELDRHALIEFLRTL
jgi:CxxC motif-containing protein (DUF1111 family)